MEQSDIPYNIRAEAFADDWALVLMQQGVIVNLDISYWRGMAKLDQNLLGINFDSSMNKFLSNYIKLGSCKIFPADLLRDINICAAEAKKNLKENSFDTVWGRFVPYSSFASWKEKNDQIQEKFMAFPERIIFEYESIIDEVKLQYVSLAEDVWKRVNKKEKTPDLFITTFVNKVAGLIPSREEIVGSFEYNVGYYTIPLPAFIAQNIKIKDEITKEIELENYNKELEKSTRREIASFYVDQKKTLLDGFLNATIGYLRKYILEICDTVMQSLSGKKEDDMTTANTINKINTMIQKVSKLNFYNDKEINDALKDLDFKINKYYGEINNEAIIVSLKKLSDLASKPFIENKNIFSKINISKLDEINE
jgi:hypothetical protein